MVGLEGKMEPMSSAGEMDRVINDPSEWGQPKRGRKSEKRQRDAVVSVRMTAAELETVQEKAAQTGQTVGGFMRDSALRASFGEGRLCIHLATSSTAPLNGSPLSDLVTTQVAKFSTVATHDVVLFA